MFQDLLSEIKEEALMLALSAFDDPSDDHIEGVYERLLFNYAYGLGSDGAVTIH